MKIARAACTTIEKFDRAHPHFSPVASIAFGAAGVVVIANAPEISGAVALGLAVSGIIGGATGIAAGVTYEAARIAGKSPAEASELQSRAGGAAHPLALVYDILKGSDIASDLAESAGIILSLRDATEHSLKGGYSFGEAIHGAFEMAKEDCKRRASEETAKLKALGSKEKQHEEAEQMRLANRKENFDQNGKSDDERNAEAQKRADAQKKADTQNRADVQRKADEAKRAEEARKKREEHKIPKYFRFGPPQGASGDEGRWSSTC